MSSHGMLTDRRTWCVVLLSMLLYVQTVTFSFVWDDLPGLVKPSPIHSLANIPKFFTASLTAGYDFQEETPYYRPFNSLSAAVGYAVWGANPAGFHLTSVLLHGVATLLVILLATGLAGSSLAGLAAGTLFALHPTHVEAVAYISAYNEVLCTIGVLAAFLCYLRFRSGGGGCWFAGSMLLFAAALLTKEMAVTFPLLVVLYELLIKKTAKAKDLAWAVVFFAILALYLVIRQKMLTVTTWESPPLPIRIATGISVVADYLRLLVFPFPLKVMYDPPIRWTLFQLPVLIPLGLLLVVAGSAAYAARRAPVVSFAIAWVFVTLVPVSCLLVFPTPAMMAERYLYLPSFGLALLAGWQFDRLSGRDNRRLAVLAVAGLLAVVLGILTVVQSFAWRDFGTLSSRMIADAPEHPIGYHCAGTWDAENGRFTDMTLNYQRSMDKSVQQLHTAARGFLSIGQASQAEAQMRRLIASGMGRPESHAILAEAMKMQGERRGQ